MIWNILKDPEMIKTYLRIFKSDLTNYYYSKYNKNDSDQYESFNNINNDKTGPNLNKKPELSIFTKETLKVAFIVTERGHLASAGDYFTALELGEGLKKLGWEITFLSKKGPENWYRPEDDVDVIISLLDVYDPRKIKSVNSSLIKIAWARNWFDRWVLNPGFSDYDIVLASSNKAVDYIQKRSQKSTFLMPIATNSDRFNSLIPPNNDYLSDYCFTGSYWNDPREIMEMLNPESIPYTFNLYGKNWEKIDKFKNYYKGFVSYSDMPYIYASTKIVIDDANRATKDFGAVNSRVFDALASGALVISNGEIGANETFNGKLPVFRSEKELTKLINYYLSHDDERISKTRELQKFVLENHTYLNRAHQLKKILNAKE